MISLPDVNVLIALAFSNHPHHNAAHRWFPAAAASGWATCLLTETGFLRLSLNPQVAGVSLGCAAAISLLKGLVAHSSHQFLEPAPSLTDSTFEDLTRRIVGYRQVSDATLLHMAKSHGYKLATFDQGIAALCPWPTHLEVIPP